MWLLHTKAIWQSFPCTLPNGHWDQRQDGRGAPAVNVCVPSSAPSSKKWQTVTKNLPKSWVAWVRLHCCSIVAQFRTGASASTASLLWRLFPQVTATFPLFHCLILTCLGLAWWAWLSWYCSCQSFPHGSLRVRTVGSAMLISIFDGSISALHPTVASQRERKKDWQYGRVRVHSDSDSLLKREREWFYPEITPPSDDLSAIE